jgi:hypothetical protein
MSVPSPLSFLRHAERPPSTANPIFVAATLGVAQILAAVLFEKPGEFPVAQSCQV